MDESTGRFSLHQIVETTGARNIEYFTISGKHFLAVASHDDGSNFGLESSIYQWNGEMFGVFQKIPTKGAVRFTFFEISGNNYLAVANRMMVVPFPQNLSSTDGMEAILINFRR